MIDISTDRTTREKWIHSFQDVTLIHFFVDLAGYDRELPGDRAHTELMDSLARFDEIANSRWFMRTRIALFLSNKSLLEAKLSNSPLNRRFPDYSGGNNVARATQYILRQFKQVNRTQLDLYPCSIQPSDPSSVRVVFEAIEEVLVQKNLDMMVI